MEKKKRRRKRKSVIRVYIARAIFALILITMLVLMFCGCLYIRDLFKKDDTDKVKTEQEVSGDVDSQSDNSDEKDESEDLKIYTQYPGVHIAIDPGHGGNDGGTVNGDIIEKDINLAIGLEVASLLEKHGVEVTLTRDSDDYMSLEERVYVTNQTTADLFVSLHCNYFEGDESIDGLEAFYCRNAESSRVYAESVANIAETKEDIIVRGATENNYYVTRKVAMDAILIEMGFLSNPAECSKLNSAEYQKLMAETIVEGILAPFDPENTTATDAST